MVDVLSAGTTRCRAAQRGIANRVPTIEPRRKPRFYWTFGEITTFDRSRVLANREISPTAVARFQKQTQAQIVPDTHGPEVKPMGKSAHNFSHDRSRRRNADPKRSNHFGSTIALHAQGFQAEGSSGSGQPEHFRHATCAGILPVCHHKDAFEIEAFDGFQLGGVQNEQLGILGSGSRTSRWICPGCRGDRRVRDSTRAAKGCIRANLFRGSNVCGMLKHNRRGL